MNYTLILSIIWVIGIGAIIFVVWRIRKTEKRKAEWLRTLSPSEDCEIHLPSNEKIVGIVKSVTEEEVELLVRINKKWIYPTPNK